MRQYKLSKVRYVHSLHFTADGSRLLAVGGPLVRTVGRAVWLDLSTGRNVGYVGRFASSYAVDPGTTRYALAGSLQYAPPIPGVEWTALGGPVEWRTFRPKGGKKPPEFKEVSALAFDATGTRLAVCHVTDGSPRLTVVEADTGDEVVSLFMTLPWDVVAFNADGSRVAVAANAVVQVYALGPKTGGKPLCSFGRDKNTGAVMFLPDNRVVAVSGRHAYILPADGKGPNVRLAGHPKQVNALALTLDGRRILTASRDGSIRTWDANSGEPGPAFEWGIGPITALAFAPDGLTCAAAGTAGKVVVWDVDS